MKSLCIKLNQEKDAIYLLNKLENYQSNIMFSYRKFKVYDNIIIHNMNIDDFIFMQDMSNILSDLILDLYEKNIIKFLISNNYFYLTDFEQKKVFDMCFEELKTSSFKQRNYISCMLFDYFLSNKSVILSGFLYFRLPEYIKFLDSIVDICVNKFIIDREFFELTEVLKDYVNSNNCLYETIHLIYINGASTLLDSNSNEISIKKDAFDNKFLSDISFSSNDYALNSLLTLLPNKLFIHLDVEDEFINTLKLIFGSRVILCNGCRICNSRKLLI